MDGFPPDSDFLELFVHFLLVNVPVDVEHRRLNATVRLLAQQLFEPIQVLQTQVDFLLVVQQTRVDDGEVTVQLDFLAFLVLDDAPDSRNLTSNKCHERRKVDVVQTLVDKVEIVVVSEGMSDKDEVSGPVKLVVSLESLVHDGTVF